MNLNFVVHNQYSSMMLLTTNSMHHELGNISVSIKPNSRSASPHLHIAPTGKLS